MLSSSSLKNEAWQNVCNVTNQDMWFGSCTMDMQIQLVDSTVQSSFSLMNKIWTYMNPKIYLKLGSLHLFWKEQIEFIQYDKNYSLMPFWNSFQHSTTTTLHLCLCLAFKFFCHFNQCEKEDKIFPTLS